MKKQRGTKSVFAREIIGRDESYVCKRLKKANFPTAEDGTIDLQEAKAWWDATTQMKHAPRKYRNDQGQNHPLPDERGDNPPEVDFWLKVVEESYPFIADYFGRVGIRSAKVWDLLAMVFFLESCTVMQMLGIPEDTPVNEAFEYTAFTIKLSQWPRSKALERWLVNELKKDEGEPFDPLPLN